MKRIFILCIMCLLSVGILFAYNTRNTDTLKETGSKKIEEPIEYKPEPIKAKILATGDIIYHAPLYKHNFIDGQYRFLYHYDKLKDYFSSADLVVGNFEGTVNPNREYSGFPMFNAPANSLKYLKEVGFDVLSTANNHCLDTSMEGIFSTITEMDANGIKHFGTYTQENREPLIVEVNGIKVGFVGHSEQFNAMDSIVPADKKFIISPMTEQLIIEDITRLKEKGVDFIIAYPHWGVEYSGVTENQKYYNDFYLKNGVDVVLGSHPHVVQNISSEIIDNEKKFTIFSMGNSLSNQREVWMNEEGVESGVVVELDIIKDENGTRLQDTKLNPTYVNRFRDINGVFQNEVVYYKDVINGGKYREGLDPNTKKIVDINYKKVVDALYNIK